MTIRSTAEQMSKSPTTIQRWKRTHPVLFQASTEFNEYGSPAELHEALKMLETTCGGPANMEYSHPVRAYAREVLERKR